MSEMPARKGTQSIERAALVLREIATRGVAGGGLWDLADRCELDRGTTHRILGALVRERLIEQRASDRRYFLGPLVFELSVTQTWFARYEATARTTLRHIARDLPNSVVLIYMRSEDDAVCLAREGASSYTSEGTGIRIGQRLPLLSLAGGAAILGALPREEAAGIVDRNAKRLAPLGRARLARIKDLVNKSFAAGHVFGEGVFWEGVTSASVPIVSGSGVVLGAIVSSKASNEFRRAHLPEVLAVLRSATEAIRDAADAMA